MKRRCLGDVGIIEHAFPPRSVVIPVGKMTSTAENSSRSEVAANDFAQDDRTEDEDDYAGYFLESTSDAVNIAERIAEANRKLYEDDGSDKENATRPRKVQFSESLVDFEPENYESDEFIESDGDLTISEEDEERNSSNREEEDRGATESEKSLKRSNRPKTANKEAKSKSEEKSEETLLESATPEEVAEEICPERDPNDGREEVESDPQQMKIVLVMLPREQSSSCESVIGEEVPGEEKEEAIVAEEKAAVEEGKESVAAAETPPKPARKSRAQTAKPCKISKISPDLNYSLKSDTKMWHANRKQGLKSKKVRIKSDGGNVKEAETILKVGKKNAAGERPNTAPEKRSCCMIRTGLPKYNGLRSEYGLSAEQLQERRRRTFEMRQQKRVDRIKKKQEEIRKRIETEENFSQWLHNKSRGNCPVMRRTAQVDTLTRSDVYIQNHAVYASRRGISYAVEYGLGKKVCKGTRMLPFERKQDKTINLGRFFDGDSPHVKRTYKIYLGSNNSK